MNHDLVSVIVPAYKRAATIEAAVRSALDQTYEHLEVIVVDDRSGDDTADIVRGIRDDRVRVLVHDKNRGGNAARATAVRHSHGRFLAFLDADDLWFPEKLEAQVAALTRSAGRDELAYTWYESALPDGTIVPARQPRFSGIAVPALLQGNFIGTFSTAVVTRAAYDRVGGLDASLPSCQDWDFYLRVNRTSGIVCVPRTLVRYWRGDADPHRISANPARVARGHAAIYRRIAPMLAERPDREAVAARRFLLEVVALHAGTRELLPMIAAIPARQWTPGAMRFLAHMVARSVRKGGLRRRRP